MKAKNSPKIAVCAAFSQGYEVIKFILSQTYKISFVATCHRDTSEFEEKIAKLCHKKKIPVLRHVKVNESDFVQRLRNDNIDLVILGWWPDIIKPDAINAVKIGWVNLHPSLLPYGRGKHGYYWDVIENKPFGVTIHFVDEGIDTGSVLFQKEIPITIEDTGESLYAKGVREIIDLFKKNYHKIAALDLHPKKQNNKLATYHHSREIEPHSEIKLDQKYKAIDLINILRARTFTNGPSAYFVLNGEKYLIRSTIRKATNL